MVFANVTPVRAGVRSLNSGRMALSGRHPATASRATTRAQRMRAASMAGEGYPSRGREGSATPRRGVRFPPHVSALAFLLVMLGVGGAAAPSSQAEAWARDATALKGSAVSGPPFRVGIARADTVPPYLAFPEPG